jgi:tetratricopeptide (TPR) repeat protein
MSPTTCFFCPNASTTVYARADREVPACAGCWNRWTADDDLGFAIVANFADVDAGRFDVAIARLHAVLEKHAPLDENGWFRSQILAQEAQVLLDKGDLEGALALEIEVAEGPVEPERRVFVTYLAAHTMEKLGRRDEATAYCTRALEIGDTSARARSDVLSTFALYARMNSIVPPRYRGLLESVAVGLGIAVHPDFLDDEETLFNAVKFIDHEFQGSMHRESELRRTMKTAPDSAERERLLADFIEREPLAPLRERARRRLEEMRSNAARETDVPSPTSR